ncbi:MAG TPA: cupin domain-containing protein [Puia sp.]|nr:cupin domain-containing protein [Puia sp.]
MPQKGQILKNPATGDVYEYLELSKDTNGERITLKQTINKGQLYPKHFHTLQDERFEVLTGKLTIWSEGKTKTLCHGEKITLPKNKPHNHYNNDNEPVTFIQTVSPALDFEYWMENIIGLTIDGKIRNGKTGFIQDLVTLKYLDSKTYLPNIPLGIQKILMNIVGPLGRLFGYRAIYKKYSGIEK